MPRRVVGKNTVRLEAVLRVFILSSDENALRAWHTPGPVPGSPWGELSLPRRGGVLGNVSREGPPGSGGTLSPALCSLYQFSPL